MVVADPLGVMTSPSRVMASNPHWGSGSLECGGKDPFGVVAADPLKVVARTPIGVVAVDPVAAGAKQREASQTTNTQFSVFCSGTPRDSNTFSYGL